MPGDGKLGEDPETNLPIYMKSGRFGPYLQLGEGENGDKPKRASLPGGVQPSAVDLDYALKLLALPRTVGIHPETQKSIMAGFGRYGPYVEHDGKYVKIDADDVFSIGLNRAVTVIAEGNTGGKGRKFGTAAQPPIKELGDHPQQGGKVQVLAGRYGPYIKWDKVNATVPKDMAPENVTMEDALRLIAERIQNSGGKIGAKGKTKAAKTVNGKTAKEAGKDKPKERASAAKKTAKPAPKSKAKQASKVAP